MCCRWLQDKKAKAEQERKTRLGARSDAKLRGVIISEKWDKKWQKYTTPNLPFPYIQKDVRPSICAPHIHVRCMLCQ
jgi:U3 small nucleolar RNA-associated protein 14